jgi:hypothetical protein
VGRGRPLRPLPAASRQPLLRRALLLRTHHPGRHLGRRRACVPPSGRGKRDSEVQRAGRTDDRDDRSPPSAKQSKPLDRLEPAGRSRDNSRSPTRPPSPNGGNDQERRPSPDCRQRPRQPSGPTERKPPRR